MPLHNRWVLPEEPLIILNLKYKNLLNSNRQVEGNQKKLHLKLQSFLITLGHQNQEHQKNQEQVKLKNLMDLFRNENE